MPHMPQKSAPAVGTSIQIPIHQRQVALPWMARLRWIAVVGQITATALAAWWLDTNLPLPWIALVIAITILSNLMVQFGDRIHPMPDWFVPGVILLDVCSLTILLYLTGGTSNPFSILYAVHVAMAVIVLGSGWAWVVVGLSTLCYLFVFFLHQPLDGVPSAALEFGRWVSLALVMVLITYFVGRVIRSARHQEAELLAARERARRNEHLVSLTTLAAGAAHELGTPLSTIALVAKEMERGQDADEMVEDARLIRQEVDRCREILDRMRVDFIEDSAHTPDSSTLAELLDDLRSDLRPAEHDRLVVETIESPNSTVSHARILRRAIGVLLRNAFDASPANENVRLLFERDSTRMIFEVQDRGPGMSQDVLRRAGEPFFTTKAPGEGMGMGLFLVRLAAESRGGTFELSSATGAGTRCSLQLPDRRGNEQHEPHNPASQIEDAGGRRRHDVSYAPGQGAVEPRI